MVGFFSQNVGGWVIMKLMEMDLMLSFINLWLISYSVSYTEWFNNLETNLLLPLKLKQTNPRDNCAKEEVFWGKGWRGCGFGFFFFLLHGFVCWGFFDWGFLLFVSFGFCFIVCFLGKFFCLVGVFWVLFWVWGFCFVFCCFVLFCWSFLFGLFLSMTINWKWILCSARIMALLLVQIGFISPLSCAVWAPKSPMCV